MSNEELRKEAEEMARETPNFEKLDPAAQEEAIEYAKKDLEKVYGQQK